MTKDELLEKALCCNRCGTCRGVVQDAIPDVAFATQCPSGMTMFGSYEPSGLMYLARGIATGDLKWNEDLARTLYSCTMCGYCDDFCQRGYRHTPALEILEELRRIIPDKLKPKTAQKAAASLIVPRSHKLGLLSAYGVVDVSESTRVPVVLFGDNAILTNSEKLHEIGFILQKSGEKTGCFISDPLPPVSADLISGGCQEALDEAMAEIDARLDDCGVKTVIVYNPESLSVLQRFSKCGAAFVSITRFCADLLKKQKKLKKVKLPLATYQDPCHLGRYAKEYAAPREIIKTLGLSLQEMWRSGRDSLCCGGGGGVRVNRPDLAKRYAANRWQEVKATGAKALITACPFCSATMRQGKPKDITIVDITTLVAQALGYTGKEARA